MPIEQTEVIDFISQQDSGNIMLSIMDNLEWGEERHLWLFQEKLNAYLRFIENGELEAQFEKAKGKTVGIHVFCQFEPDRSGMRSLLIAKKTLKDAGYTLSWEVVRKKRSSTV